MEQELRTMMTLANRLHIVRSGYLLIRSRQLAGRLISLHENEIPAGFPSWIDKEIRNGPNFVPLFHCFFETFRLLELGC